MERGLTLRCAREIFSRRDFFFSLSWLLSPFTFSAVRSRLFGLASTASAAGFSLAAPLAAGAGVVAAEHRACRCPSAVLTAGMADGLMSLHFSMSSWARASRSVVAETVTLTFLESLALLRDWPTVPSSLSSYSSCSYSMIRACSVDDTTMAPGLIFFLVPAPIGVKLPVSGSSCSLGKAHPGGVHWACHHSFGRPKRFEITLNTR